MKIFIPKSQILLLNEKMDWKLKLSKKFLLSNRSVYLLHFLHMCAV